MVYPMYRIPTLYRLKILMYIGVSYFYVSMVWHRPLIDAHRAQMLNVAFVVVEEVQGIGDGATNAPH